MPCDLDRDCIVTAVCYPLLVRHHSALHGTDLVCGITIPLLSPVQEQKLRPGEKIDMPVFFYLDPEFATDPRLKRVNNLTLSYTFFKVLTLQSNFRFSFTAFCFPVNQYCEADCMQLLR